MTANQISYAVAQEQNRHNEQSEQLEQQRIDETVRHDKEIEAINQRTNDLTEAKNSFEYAYKTEQLQHQKRMDTLTYEMQKAQGDKRNQLQEEMNNITAIWNDRMSQLKSWETDIKQQEQFLKDKAQNEIELHNRNMEALQLGNLELQGWMKQVDDTYRRHALDTESGLRNQEIQNAKNNLRILETHQIRTHELEERRVDALEKLNAANIKHTEAQTALVESNKFWNPWNNLTGGFKNITDGLRNTMQAGSDIVRMLATGGL